LSAGKSSKSRHFQTGKIIPVGFCYARETTGTVRLRNGFDQHTEERVMYIGLGGLLILILVLWLLGVI
jgi:hypothetical protein